MQRAAASTPPTTHCGQSQGAETPPSKRQKTLHVPTSTTTPNSDHSMIQAAVGEEEEKREKAIERSAAEAGETKWVLSTVNVGACEVKHGLRIAVGGYSDIDQDAWRPAMVGRRSFGKFNRELEVGSVDNLLTLASAGMLYRVCNQRESCFSLMPLCIHKIADNILSQSCKANKYNTHRSIRTVQQRCPHPPQQNIRTLATKIAKMATTATKPQELEN